MFHSLGADRGRGRGVHHGLVSVLLLAGLLAGCGGVSQRVRDALADVETVERKLPPNEEDCGTGVTFQINHDEADFLAVEWPDDLFARLEAGERTLTWDLGGDLPEGMEGYAIEYGAPPICIAISDRPSEATEWKAVAGKVTLTIERYEPIHDAECPYDVGRAETVLTGLRFEHEDDGGRRLALEKAEVTGDLLEGLIGDACEEEATEHEAG